MCVAKRVVSNRIWDIQYFKSPTSPECLRRGWYVDMMMLMFRVCYLLSVRLYIWRRVKRFLSNKIWALSRLLTKSLLRGH